MSSVALRPQPTSIPAGTEEAARLFEGYSEQIFGYCLRHLGSRSEAEDAVQTTFLYALRALRRGVVPECDSAWLTAIAKNVCRWQQRTLDRRGPLASDVDLDRVGLARPDGDEEEILAGLKDALASLPERQRRALVLREWQGLPSREIATKLEMTPTATYALLTRARRSLAQALTASQRPVLGLNVGTLLYQLRVHLKALFGGATAKVATASVVAAAVVGGGVAVERAVDQNRSAPRTPGSAQEDPRAAAVTLAVSTPRAGGVKGVAPAKARGVSQQGLRSATTESSTPGAPARASIPTGWTHGADAVPGADGEPTPPPSAETPVLPRLAVDLPARLAVDPPGIVLPAVDILPPLPLLPLPATVDVPGLPELPDPGLPPLP